MRENASSLVIATSISNQMYKALLFLLWSMINKAEPIEFSAIIIQSEMVGFCLQHAHLIDRLPLILENERTITVPKIYIFLGFLRQ